VFFLNSFGLRINCRLLLLRCGQPFKLAESIKQSLQADYTRFSQLRLTHNHQPTDLYILIKLSDFTEDRLVSA
jgi:hypothetical protein